MKKAWIFAAGLLAIIPSTAFASSVISNGTVSLGVNNLGELNYNGVGVQQTSTGLESTFDGCPCEGWGVGIGDTGVWGGANQASYGSGGANLNLDSFTSTASTATSVTSLTGGELSIKHEFSPSANSSLYSVKVSITNTSGVDINDLRYRRAMDWDINPTIFNEYVTIQGTSGASAILFASDNGFADSNVFNNPGSILFSGDTVDSGPADHGAVFDFGFGALKAGATFDFEIFYGVNLTERGILAALASVGAEVYSLGQAACDPDGDGLGCEGTGRPSATFAFGFKGVGGTPIPGVPLPAAGILLLTGLAGLGGLGRLRRSA